jgi:hypothetical protein
MQPCKLNAKAVRTAAMRIDLILFIFLLAPLGQFLVLLLKLEYRLRRIAYALGCNAAKII